MLFGDRDGETAFGAAEEEKYGRSGRRNEGRKGRKKKMERGEMFCILIATLTFAQEDN